MSDAKTDNVKRLRAELDKFQGELSEKSRDIWLAGLGVFSVAEEEGSKLYKDFLERGKDLVKRGEDIEKKGKDFAKEGQKEVTERVDDAIKFVEERFNTAMDSIGFTSKDEVKDLSAKVDKLTATVENLTKKLQEKEKAVK